MEDEVRPPPETMQQISTSTVEAEEVQQEQGDAIDEILPFLMTSPDFKEGEPIPSEYSCDGQDRSPTLVWSGVPQGTSSLTLIMDDPDAPGGTWVHWVLFNIPVDVTGLEAAIASGGISADGSTHGANSWGRSDYGGPCPPSGSHRYFFKLYALDSYLTLPEGAPVEMVYEAMESHKLAETSLTGTYSR